MSLQLSCCCGPCWYGVYSNTGDICTHNTDERLELRCPRPAYGYGRVLQGFGNAGARPCVCGSEPLHRVETYCPSSPDIVVRYEHFNERDTTAIYEWWYAKADSSLYPACADYCCETTDDTDCCSSGGTSARCNSNGYRTIDGTLCSDFQESMIKTGQAASVFTPTGITPTPCNTGDQYKWLDGLSNYGSGSFNHWYVDASGSVVGPVTKTYLPETLVCITGPQKWWERYWNGLSTTDNPTVATSSDNAAAASRTPRWILYQCAMQPIFSFELFELSSLSTAEAEAVLIAVNNGTPIAAASIQKLVNDGILVTPRDHGGTSGTRPIKKTIRDNSQNKTEYFWAAPGGWSYACYDFSGTVSADLATYWPQIPLRYSIGSGTWGGSCFSSTPAPGNSCVCDDLDHDPLNPLDTCNACNPPRGCSLNPSPTCNQGNGYAACDGDVIIGNCHGIRGQYFSYKQSVPDSTWLNPHVCEEYQSTVGRYPSADEPSNKNNPVSIDYSKIPPPADLSHFVPWQVAMSFHNGESQNPACCGGHGVWRETLTVCGSTQPAGAACS